MQLMSVNANVIPANAVAMHRVLNENWWRSRPMAAGLSKEVPPHVRHSFAAGVRRLPDEPCTLTPLACR